MSMRVTSVHVALRSEVGEQDGPEEGEAADRIAAAELGDALVLDLEREAHAASLVSDGPWLAPRVAHARQH
jgi:Arc/MetJ family transcription regulator